MPDMTPVATQIVPPDPQSGLRSIAGILGIQQQRQALQTGAANLQSAQAKATVDTQTANENQNLAKLLQDPVGNGIVDQNGNPTVNSQKIVMQAAPTTGNQHYSDFVNAATNKVKFNGALNDLRTSERADVLQTYAGAAAGADSPDDIKAVGAQLLASKQGTPEYNNYQDIVKAMNDQVDNTVKHQNAAGQLVPPGQEPWRKAVLNATRAGLPPSQTVGPGGLATPQQTTTGAGTVNRNAVTGGLSAPPGAAPGSALNPTPPQVAGQTTRQVATGNADVDRANQVSSMVAPANQTVTITKEIDDLADQVRSGKISQAVSKAAAAVGLDSSTYARQLLEKDLGKLKATATANAQSDQRQATVLSGFPDATSDNQTIHTAMDYTRGVARQDLARGDLLNQVKSKDPSLRGFQHADDVLTGNTDPLMHEFNALKTPQERIGFYKRNFTDPAKAQEFRDKVAGMGHLNVIGQ